MMTTFETKAHISGLKCQELTLPLRLVWSVELGGGRGSEVWESLQQNLLWPFGDCKVNKITLSHGASQACSTLSHAPELRALLTLVPVNLFFLLLLNSTSPLQSAPPTPSGVPSLELAFTRLQRKPAPSLGKQTGLRIRPGKDKRRERDQAASAGVRETSPFRVCPRINVQC